MLDTRAKELTEHELPEILSMLPPLDGCRVLELGAGIGWVKAHFKTILPLCLIIVIVPNKMSLFVEYIMSNAHDKCWCFSWK